LTFSFEKFTTIQKDFARAKTQKKRAQTSVLRFFVYFLDRIGYFGSIFLSMQQIFSNLLSLLLLRFTAVAEFGVA